MVRQARIVALLLCAALPALADAQAAPAAGARAPAAGGADASARSLEDRVSDLKEKIFRTKARLKTLQEMAIGGDAATGSRTVLVHRNEMGSAFRLESVEYVLDGKSIFAKADEGGDLQKVAQLPVYSGRIAPGSHQLTVRLEYRGHGYGVFSYLDGYKFRVQSSYTFNAEVGQVNTIRVVGFERGGLTAELKDRPAVRFDVEVEREETTRGAIPAAAEGDAR